MGNRADVRELVREELYVTHDVIEGIVEGSSTATLIIDAAHLKSAVVKDEELIGKWVLITSGTEIGDISRIQQYDNAAGKIVLKPDLSGAPSASDTYEIHWFRPTYINEQISWALRRGTKGALNYTDDSTSQLGLEDQVVAEGALYRLRLAQARRMTGADREKVATMAADHRENFIQGCADHGYNVIIGDEGRRAGAPSEAEVMRRA